MMFFAEVICVDKRKKEATKGPIHTGKSGSDPLISFLPSAFSGYIILNIFSIVNGLSMLFFVHKEEIV